MQKYFSSIDIKLTEDQKKGIEKLKTFLQSKNQIFLLKGYAGTGKTFLMKGLTKYLKDIKNSFAIAAPTGRAAKIISQKTKEKVYTIHKTIYSNTDLKEYKTQNKDGTETFKFFFDLKQNQYPINTIFIIDEASMISDIYSEGEFFRFGSGYLLTDLIKFALSNKEYKIIFIGDNAQLPPVNMNFSPALNPEYLKTKFELILEEFELTEVVRQKRESGILLNSIKLREAIKLNIFNELDIDTNYTDVESVDKNLLNDYLKACNNKLDIETIIIAYSNRKVKEYNDLVRSHFFPNTTKIHNGDYIVLVQNNYNYEIELLNGEFGIVSSVENVIEQRIVKLKEVLKSGKTIEKDINLVFRNVTILFNDIDDKPHLIHCKIIENLLYSDERDISSDEMKALYIDFWIRNPKINKIRQLLHAKSVNSEKLKNAISDIGTGDIDDKILEKLQEEYFKKPTSKKITETSLFILKEVLKNDSYFNALRIKFGYAVTCHKAQGGEWKNAFVDCKTSMGYFNASYYRWLYTAITRAETKLFTIREPHYKIGSTLKPPKTQHFTQRNDIIVFSETVLDNEIPFQFPKNNQILNNIYYSVFDLIKDENITIVDIKHHSFCEHYYFSRGENISILFIDYGGNDKISSIRIKHNDEFSVKLQKLLKSIINKTIIVEKVENSIETNIEKNFDFPHDKPFLSTFYKNIKSLISEYKIIITNITHHLYLEKYEFTKNGHQVFIDFYYNKKGQFKRTVPNEKKTTSIELMQLILDKLNTLK